MANPLELLKQGYAKLEDKTEEKDLDIIKTEKNTGNPLELLKQGYSEKG